jgi:hypothetical protein
MHAFVWELALSESNQALPEANSFSGAGGGIRRIMYVGKVVPVLN